MGIALHKFVKVRVKNGIIIHQLSKKYDQKIKLNMMEDETAMNREDIHSLYLFLN